MPAHVGAQFVGKNSPLPGHAVIPHSIRRGFRGQPRFFIEFALNLAPAGTHMFQSFQLPFAKA
jgi:hypothetical protein